MSQDSIVSCTLDGLSPRLKVLIANKLFVFFLIMRA